MASHYTASAPSLVCLGAGPKSLAVALLIAVIRSCLRVNLNVVIVEKAGIAANWAGQSGYTDGEFPLDTSPLKDLGFPYMSGYGPEVDHHLGHYSYIEYLKQTGQYPDWVSRGHFQMSHREFSQYLRWVGCAIDARIVKASVVSVLPKGKKVETTLDVDGHSQLIRSDGLVLTGPGKSRRVAIQDDAPRLVFDARTYWQQRDTFKELGEGSVAVVGGGQSAGTAAMSLLMENPRLRVDIINRHGFLCAQSAGFTENALCTTGQGWQDLPRAERLEILAKVNSGVVTAEVKQFLDRHRNVRVIRGSVREVHAAQKHVELVLDARRGEPLKYDRVVLALGFDPLGQLAALLPQEFAQSTWFSELANNRNVDHHFRLPGLDCNIHMPSLSGMSQGPGFPLLSCLGSVASRIVSTYIPVPASAAACRADSANGIETFTSESVSREPALC